MTAITTEQRDQHLTIKVSGQFTFALFKEFSATYKTLEPKPDSIDIDLRDTDYIDSAALGMLLSMRNYIGTDAIIQLLHANETVRRLLEIARFNKKFVMS